MRSVDSRIINLKQKLGLKNSSTIVRMILNHLTSETLWGIILENALVL